ncbi:hypothetical protein [Actinoplanes sp. NPDC051851]|uniref:hypothetical protein n=1 Tax=Actinoplanes sp. NPDC051851 TaxID=3154753 RepID=UPI00341CA7E5
MSERHIELEASDHEEPTWEVRGPRKKRFDRRSRVILAAAAILALMANAGAAWAYWRIARPESTANGATTEFELVLRARNDLNQTLRPGDTGNMTVTVANEYGVPIRVTQIRPGAGNVVADPEHRDAGCLNPRVAVNRKDFPVSWEVAKNTVGVFNLDDALTMRPGSPKACLGATFTVPIRARAVR